MRVTKIVVFGLGDEQLRGRSLSR